MKKVKLISIVLCMFLFLTGCGTKYIGGDRTTKWEKDLSYLTDSLKLKHPNLFFNVSEEEFNKEINDLENNIQNLNDDEIENKIYRIVASIGDAHTSVYGHYEKRFPVQFYYFKNDMYLINTTEEYKEALNCKLVKVNDKNISEVEDSLKPLIAAENEANIKKTLPNFLARPDILAGAKIIDSRESIKFTLEDSNKKQFDIEVKETGERLDFIYDKDSYDESYPLYMQNSDSNYWYKYLEDSKTLYFKYNSCFEKSDKKIDDLFSEIFEYIDDNKVDKLVIDVRNNSGGRDSVLNPLIERLKTSIINDSNKLYVIVGRQTFSAAIVNTEMLRENTNATLIGEPTSNKANHYGAPTQFKLPNSGISAGCSTKQCDLFNDNGNSIIPDKIIEPSIDDYVNKKDPVLDFIIKN